MVNKLTLSKHALSLKPYRHADESPEEFRVRRERLNKITKAYAKGFGRLLYVSTKGGLPARNTDKLPKPEFPKTQEEIDKLNGVTA